jgi:hypothetical protein
MLRNRARFRYRRRVSTHLGTTNAMMAISMPFHPLAEIFPLIEGEEFDALCGDIRKHGLREPITIFENRILDGRNRYRACQALGIEPAYKTYVGSDPVSFVISLNLNRRHLNESQRALVAAKLANLRVGDNQHSEGLPIGRASTLLNVGERSAARARNVLDHGAPELQAAVARGGLTVAAAVKLIRGTLGTGDNEWNTPKGYIDAARAVLGAIDLDPASNDVGAAED